MTDEKITKGRDMGLMPVTRGQLAPADWGEYVAFARMVSTSGMVPKQYDGNAGACLVAFQMGAEIGLKPMAAVQNIAVINGRPSLWGDGLLAVVVAHPDCEGVDETDPGDITDTATCTVKRRGRSPVTRTFSIEDAKTAGLWKKTGPWTQYPKRMLQMRARGFACRDAFPDALRGLHLAEEAVDIPMTAEWVDEPKPATPPAGRHSVRPEKPAAEPKPAPEPTPDPPPAEAKPPEPEAEPDHDPETGEVKGDKPATIKDALAWIECASNSEELDSLVPMLETLKGKSRDKARAAFKAKRETLKSAAEFDGVGPDAMTDAESAEAQAALSGAGF